MEPQHIIASGDLESTITASNPTKPIRCIVKLGGAAITCKNELEKINEENLQTVCSQLRQAIIAGSASKKVLDLDWSKRPQKSEISIDVEDFQDQSLLGPGNFVVVHGAGSFGHFQASKSGVHKGGLDQSLVKAGFVATRISVTTLNLEIVRALAREGIVSVGMSPFSCGWTTSKRNLESADLTMVAKSINSGFVPVLHGDAVLDKLQGCTILSGDVIIRHLAAYLKPEYVVFLPKQKLVISLVRYKMISKLNLTGNASGEDDQMNGGCNLEHSVNTDVLGVYDRPPSEPNAVLLREIAVREDGSWAVVQPKLQNSDEQVEITVAAHDTTGGMVTKISEAALIAKLGIDVYIVKAATSHSMRALNGEVRGGIPEDWLGTVIHFVGNV